MNMPGYSLDPDAESKLLTVSLSGHWDLDILRNYQTDRQAAIRSMVSAGVAEADIRVLVDRRNQSVQSQDVAAALSEMLRDVEMKTARTAVIVSGALQRIQTIRTSGTERTRVFTDEHEAKAWLLREQPD